MSIFGKEYRFKTPLSEGDVRQLKSGDIVYISGEIWSGRSMLLKRFVENREPLPIDTRKLNVFFTGGEGLLPADDAHRCWEPQPLGATLGLRFEKWFPALIRDAGLRALITKGNTGPGTMAACMQYGCVQLTPFGWTVTPHFTDVLTEKVRDEEVYWREAGMTEALIVYHVGDTGPWLVNIDTEGNVLYNRLYRNVNRRVNQVYKKIGLPEKFKFSSLEQ